MIEKLRLQFNKKYTTISLYIIFTVMIIFLLAYTATRIEDILRYISGTLSYISHLLTPVIVGIVMAYVLDPLVDMFEKLYKKVRILKFKNEKKYRSLSVFSCILLILVLLFLLMGIFIFSITKQISSIRIDEFVTIVTNYINSFSDSLKGIENKLAYYHIESGALQQYITQFPAMVLEKISSFVNGLTKDALNITSSLSNLVFGLIVAIYLLLEKAVFLGYIDMISRALFSEKMRSRFKSYWLDFDNIFSGYIRGQLLDALFMSVILSISLSVIGIKFGTLIGIMAGLCNLIPYFGPIVAFAGTIFFGVLNAQFSKVLIAIVVLIIIQQIDGNVIGPRLMSSGVALKPVFVLIAIIIGSQVGGVYGMVLAVPVAALIKLFVKRYVEERLKKCRLEEV